MATSPNYGWLEPDNTDLVKNGALAIRTLGNAIDTTMATMTPKSTVTTKGDLVAATGASTPARLAVGNNGETLVADSSATTGLRYTAGNPIPNPVLNSAMQVWQRSTSTALSAGVRTFIADRWEAFCATANMTISRQATGDTTNLPNVQYVQRLQRTSGSTGTSTVTVAQNMESINSIPFAGKTITYSFYARKGANFSGSTVGSIDVFMLTGTGTDQNVYTGYTGSSTIINSTITLTSTITRYTITTTVPTTATQIGFYFNFTPTGTAGANDYFDVSAVQIDIGSVALPFRTNGATPQGELAACQRYYWRSSKMETFGHHGIGIGKNGTSAMIDIKLPVTMRVKPTSIDFNAVAAYDTSSVLSATAVNFQGTQGTADQVALDVVFASGGTQFRPYFLIANNDTNGYIGLSAEL